MTRDELKATHPDYDYYLAPWQFFIRSYWGGKAYRDGNYLLQHPFESPENYARRKATAYYYNYCRPIVDIFVSHLFKKPPSRDFGSLTDDPLFKSFLEDADLEGKSYSQFMRDAQRFAGIYGRVSIIVDKPSAVAKTRAEEISGDIRPYCSLITPENLFDWAFIRTPDGRTILDMVKIYEGGNYRIWTRTGWELWEVTSDEKDGEVKLIESGKHDLGEIPIVNLYNLHSGFRMVGISDIQDIADVNKNIYYLCSDAKEIIENAAFPMLAMPYARGGEEEKEVGPKNILQFDPSEPNSKPYWLEPPHSSLSEIREWIKQDIEEIHRTARLRGVRGQDSKQPWSGIALDMENNMRDAALKEKADNVEKAEKDILRLWGLWEKKKFDGVIDYPSDFSLRDLDRDMDNSIKAIDAGVPSPKFLKETYKKIARGTLPKVDDATRREISEEIDSANIQVQPESGGTGVQEGA